MKILHLECSSGLGGDMFLASLADLGVDLHLLESALRAAGLGVRLICRSTTRQGLSGKFLEIQEETHQPLRRLSDIKTVLAALPLSGEVIQRSLSAIERLGQVEAQVHGMAVEDVHFHEIGAMDTIVDVVGAFWALETLEIEQVFASPLPWFEGRIDCAHGFLPLPAPAVVELLKNKPVYPTEHRAELITPTGALLLDQIVAAFGPQPCGTLLGCGIGLGRTELARQPNALRSFLVDARSPSIRSASRHQALETIIEDIVVLETNIDHLTGEELGACFEGLLQDGALDVLFTPGVMKKNRPGGLLQVICRPEDLPEVEQAVFRHSMTLGLRRRRMERVVLKRTPAARETPFGSLPTKQTTLDKQIYARPEFEALKKLAQRSGRTVAQLRYLLQSTADDAQFEEGAEQDESGVTR
ncbi:MAG TPA: nickel pincer cofactor biosynthesis protein LarC [Desulfonatronum sp.]|nr:nickel pincer cofactor biosynthesis protein LarC [Desulfonatronum sp.]